MSTVTRDTILRSLRARGKSTINELAEAAHVSPVSIRHHLAALQAEKLVAADELKHGVGRPRLVFTLTDAGMDLFPTRYFRFTNRLLDEIKEAMPQEKVRELFAGVADTMAGHYAQQLQALPLGERMKRMVALLSEEGFEAELQDLGDRVLIREMSCPYFRIGRQHPEVCHVDQTFIAAALSLPVERVTCLLQGDAHCTFSVAMDQSPREVPSYE